MKGEIMSEFQPPKPNYPRVYETGAATASGQVAAEQAEQRFAQTMRTAIEQGKEPFDFARFVEMYWLKDVQNDGLTGQEAQSVVDDLARRYYLDFPDIMTMADFAKALELGDMLKGE
jgi:hypothetical protein